MFKFKRISLWILVNGIGKIFLEIVICRLGNIINKFHLLFALLIVLIIEWVFIVKKRENLEITK
jgi:hypothetical protein